MEFFRFDRFDNPLGAVQDAIDAYHYQEAGGENSLTLTTSTPLSKGERIVWYDEEESQWREHVVDKPTDERGSNGALKCEAYCEDALAETFRDKVDEKRIRGGTATQALKAALEQTRWELGICTVTGARTVSFYHCSVGEALQTIADTWDGEIFSTFATDENGVTHRYVNFVPAMGSRDTHKRFEYGKDLVSVKRTVQNGDVYTAMRGYGKGEQTGEDSWGRRITFEEINGGKDYVEDLDALTKWGRPDGKGGKVHAFGTVIFEDCEDARELMELTAQELEGSCEPKVAYECDVTDRRSLGYAYEGYNLGDDVALVDTTFTPTLRLQARVMAKKRNLLAKADVSVTIGNIRNTIGDEVVALTAKMSALQRRSANWDVAAYTPVAYLNQLIDKLNAQFDAAGSYQYASFEQGTIWSSVPLDEGFRPTRTPAMAIQLKGGGFRIANTVKADGSFDWRTFGTGDGFTADYFNAGVIQGGSNWWNLGTGDLEFSQGGIRDTKGKNYWDLDTGEFSLSASASVGGSPAGGMVVECDVQYGLSDSDTVQPTSWTTTALWQQGKHLWTRTKSTLADGSVQYSTPRRIANDSGIGASEVIEQYYLSTSNTAQTGGSWLNSQPSWVSGRYYWTRSRITWSDGSVTYTDPVLARALTTANQSTDDLDDELTQREIFNRLTNNGQTQGIYLSNGLLYINATYLKSGIISDGVGRNTWNLATGALTTNYMNANNITAKGTMESGYDTSYKAKMTGGYLRFYYNSAETIEMVSIPSYTSGAKGGYIQACSGSTYLGLRAPKLYTATNTSEAGTTGYTGSQSYIAQIDNLGDGRIQWWTGSMSFKNGICTST